MSAAPSRLRPSAPTPVHRSALRERPAAGLRAGSRRADRDVLWLYLLSRAGVWATAYCARWLFPADRDARRPAPVLSTFEQWDWGHYLRIAREGYFPGSAGPWQSGWDNREAFFPGFPLTLRAVHAVVPSWTAAGLLISFAAGAVAVLALARIARLHLPETIADRRAVLLLLCSPCAVFLAVGYTEALFLALALPAWLAAQRGDWRLAAILTALATTVRVSGLFLAAAVALHFLLTARADRPWRAWPWLALPALPVAAFTGFLHARTGDWMAWQHAQERGWYRAFHPPWETWANTWRDAFDRTRTTDYAFMFQAELAALAVGVLLCGLLLLRRRWPEALYVGLSLCALGTSYWYTSIPRATLLWWPLWIALAGWSLRGPRFLVAHLCLAAPVTTVFALAFFTGRWAG
ncbi:Mannosyltransferase (PIG-V) [Streptomyces sp. ADI96-02]|uniref:mannosyltransferase family protein n=1 Tax=Streptomyces sp. ADI96-02 TaxID=1522760 RepID=UPI000F54F9E9|nr:mannosyltransferase family protein [Streptomyces sp. ADI96-02]RPK61319.1 Mannosyltransferase (PIG-V) [Streptomyces sp. ADI96-02]